VLPVLQNLFDSKLQDKNLSYCSQFLTVVRELQPRILSILDAKKREQILAMQTVAALSSESIMYELMINAPVGEEIRQSSNTALTN
jgi:hypothetical protein